MPEPPTKPSRALKWRTGQPAAGADETVAVEEPLEIRLGGRRFTLTMRTPGHDGELAAGFLLAEGFINSKAELGEVRAVADSRGNAEPNVVDVILSVPAAGLRERLKRNFTISSSCGICGKTSIESIQRRIASIESPLRISAAEVLMLPHLMRQAQQVFSATGGLHAAALFRFNAEQSLSSSAPINAERASFSLLTHETQPPSQSVSNRKEAPFRSPLPGQTEPPSEPLLPDHTRAPSESPLADHKGPPSESPLPDQGEGQGEGPSHSLELAVLREDVGRHNAVDKVIGHALLHEWLPLSRHIMMVSGRLSFEIVQKAAAAGIPILAAVSAPSSLAVELAGEVGMTLIGFVRDTGFNVYTFPQRLIA